MKENNLVFNISIKASLIVYMLSSFYMTLGPGLNVRTETFPDERPNATLLFQVAVETARYSGESQRIFTPPSAIHSCDIQTPLTLALETAIDFTISEWPSSVRCSAPVAASQSRTVLSYDPDTTSRPSGEKATDLTVSEWPSSVCCSELVTVS